MAYAFNDDKSKVEVYTKDDINKGIKVIKASLTNQSVGASQRERFVVLLSNPSTFIPEGYTPLGVVGVQLSVSSGSTGSLDNLVLSGFRYYRLANDQSDHAEVFVRNVSNTNVTKLNIYWSILCVKTSLIS